MTATHTEYHLADSNYWLLCISDLIAFVALPVASFVAAFHVPDMPGDTSRPIVVMAIAGLIKGAHWVGGLLVPLPAGSADLMVTLTPLQGPGGPRNG